MTNLSAMQKDQQVPLISVVITTYNHGDKLKQALESVCQQSYPNIELIVVDDASKDKTGGYLRELADALADRETNVALKVITTQGLGIGYSRRLGLDVASGRYLFMMDGDDWIDDADYFLKAIEIMREDEEIAAYVCRKSKYFEVRDTSEPETPFQFDGKTQNAKFIDELGSTFRPNWVQIIVDMQRTPVIERFKKIALQEFPMYLMCVFADVSRYTYILNEPAVTYRVHDGQFSKNIDANFILQIHKGTMSLSKELETYRHNYQFLLNRSKRMFEYYIGGARHVSLFVLLGMVFAMPARLWVPMVRFCAGLILKQKT